LSLIVADHLPARAKGRQRIDWHNAMTNGVTAMALQIKKAFVALLIFFFVLVSTALAQDSDKFGWSVTPYIWASDTSLDISVRDTGIGGGADIKFSDLLDDLDTAIQIHVEGGKGNWSGFGDLTYIETSDTTQRPLRSDPFLSSMPTTRLRCSTPLSPTGRTALGRS
jgi:hypothetical protein